MNSIIRVARPPSRPLLIFDGDCAFCRRWIERWKQTTGDHVNYAPLQSEHIAAQFPELSREQLESSVHLIEPDGRVTRGTEAVFRSLAVRRRWPLWLYDTPGFAPTSETAARGATRTSRPAVAGSWRARSARAASRPGTSTGLFGEMTPKMPHILAAPSAFPRRRGGPRVRDRPVRNSLLVHQNWK